MTSIRLYKPHDVDITINFPTTWDDLSLEDMSLVADAIFLKKSSEVELLLGLLANQIAIAEPNAKSQKRKRIMALLSQEDISMNYKALLAFIHKNNRTVNPLPKLNDLVGPADNFDDLTVGEYEDADIYFRRCIDTKDFSQIESLLKVLYRPAVNSARVSYTNYDIKTAPLNISSNQADFKNALSIMMWYMGCRETLPKLFPLVFNGDNSSTESEPDYLAITKLIHHGAGLKNGTRAQIRAMLLKEFLFDLQLEAESQPNVV